MKKEFEDSTEGVSSFKNKMLWDFASALGVSNEQAIEMLSYTATHMHNLCVDDPSLVEEFKPFIRSLFRCFPIAAKTELAVWIGLHRKAEEIKPVYFDEVMAKAKKGGLSISTSFAEIDIARKLGLN